MTCFRQALPEIETLSCVPLDSTGTGHENSTAALMIANQVYLMKDLERLNDLVAIARNIVATTKVAQNLAATEKFDQQVLKCVDLCVRVTSRCYDGNSSPRVEGQWSSIITACKSPASRVSRHNSRENSSISTPAPCSSTNSFNSQKTAGHLFRVSPQSDAAQRAPQASSVA